MDTAAIYRQLAEQAAKWNEGQKQMPAWGVFGNQMVNPFYQQNYMSGVSVAAAPHGAMSYTASNLVTQ